MQDNKTCGTGNSPGHELSKHSQLKVLLIRDQSYSQLLHHIIKFHLKYVKYFWQFCSILVSEFTDASQICRFDANIQHFDTISINRSIHQGNMLTHFPSIQNNTDMQGNQSPPQLCTARGSSTT